SFIHFGNCGNRDKDLCLLLGKSCLPTCSFSANLVVHDLHLQCVAREIQVHQVFLKANRDRIVGGKFRGQVINFGLVTPNVDVTVQSHRNVVEIVMRLQWCAISISTCSYGRGRHILFLDVDDCPLLGLYRSILLSTPCHPLDTLPTSGREVAQKGKRTERIQRWLSRWNCVTAICTPPPIVRWSRSASGKLPSTSPGVRKTSFFPPKV